MLDNGLLEYYRSQKPKKGYLNLRKQNLDIQPLIITDKKRIYKVSNNNQNFYAKMATKQESNAEIIIAQIMQQAGLNVATYTAGKVGPFEKVVICEDLMKDGCISARDHKVDFHKYSPFIVTPLLMPMKLQEKKDLGYYSHFITKDAMVDLIKTRFLHTVVGNYDGNKGNIIFGINEENVISSVSSFDNAIVGSKNHINIGYYSEFTSCFLNRDAMLTQFKENETMRLFVHPHELAEGVGNINVQALADNIENETGYVVDQEFIDKQSFNINSVAEEMIHC